jgi:hypothetical protein
MDLVHLGSPRRGAANARGGEMIKGGYDKPILARRPANEGIGAGSSFQRVRIIAHRPAPAIKDVVAGASSKAVSAGAARKGVCRLTTYQTVVPGPAIGHVKAPAADELIIACTEPPRFCRRLFCLSYAAMAG